MSSRRFQNKTVIVTGGSSGIGRASAIKLAKEGANVAVIARNKQAGKELVSEVASFGENCSFHQADISKPEQVEEAIANIIKRYGQFDAAFNNAGEPGGLSDFHALAASDFDKVIQTNLYGTYHCMALQIRHFVECEIAGAIVNCSSAAGLVGVPFQTAYCASKHAVVGMTKSVALEYAEQGIRVNAICPGGVMTPMLKDFIKNAPKEKSRALGLAPINRPADPEEIANLVAWLCSDEASFVVGQAYAIDGGYTV